MKTKIPNSLVIIGLTNAIIIEYFISEWTEISLVWGIFYSFQVDVCLCRKNLICLKLSSIQYEMGLQAENTLEVIESYLIVFLQFDLYDLACVWNDLFNYIRHYITYKYLLYQN